MSPSIKVLSLPFWAKPWSCEEWGHSKEDYLSCVGNEIPPVFNRHGLYLDRYSKTCWVEGPFGCHDYPEGYNYFLYDLSIFNHRPFTESERHAMWILMMSHITNRTMKELYYRDCQWWDLHKLCLETRKGVTRMLKKTEKKNEVPSC